VRAATAAPAEAGDGVFAATRRRPRARWCAGAALLALCLLAACAEQDEVLRGQREDIRTGVDVTDIVVENRSVAIRLPAQTANADWTASIGSPRTRVAHPALSAAPQVVWSTGIGSGNTRKQRITASPVVAGGRIFTLDATARVSAVSTGGSVLWSTDLTPAGERAEDATGGGLSVSGDTVFVSVGFGTLAALDATSGQVRWRQDLDASGSGTPTVRDGIVYLVAGDLTGWAVDAADGRILWQVEATPSVANVLGAPAPAVTDDLAIFGFGSGDVVATFRRGGLRRWSASVVGQRPGLAVSRIGDITGDPVVVGNQVYVGNQAGRTVAFSTGNGTRLWTADAGALGPIWPAGGSLFLVADDNRLLRIDAADGATIWSVELPGFVRDRPRRRGAIVAHYGPILAGGQVIVASSDGLLRFFDPTDGRLVRTTEVPGGAASAPVVAGRTLYLVGGKGELFAFR
jgi:outer membrane protein assembly factor BamB